MHSSRAWSTIILVLVVSLTGCSSSDDDGPSDPGGGTVDTTAPVVLSVDPRDGDIGVGTDQSITVTFNEAMDPTSDDGAITLSHGNTGVAGSWSDDRTLEIAHGPFPEATEVTLTLSTALADTSGNNLANAYSVEFFTESSNVVLLESDPDEGAIGVDRNVTIVLQFSEDMNLSTLGGFVSVDDGNLGRVPVDFTLSEGDAGQVLVDPAATLPENATITVTVGQGAQAQSGATLAASETLSFTTGVTADTTPPTLVGITPASGSTISANTSTFVLQFSEPIDDESLSPDYFSGQFALLIEAFSLEPTWSPDGTTLTVPLPTPLPAGLPILVGFPPFRDRAGNLSTEGFEFRVTVEGASDPWPFVDGVVAFIAGVEEQVRDGVPQFSSYEDALRYEEQPNGDFHLATYSLDFTEAYNYDVFERTDDAVLLKAFADAEEGVFGDPVTLSPPVPFLQEPLSVGNRWTGSTTATEDGASVTIDWAFEVVGQADLPTSLGIGENGLGERLIWVDTWAIVLEYEFRSGATLVSSGTDSTYYAPNIGRVRSYSFEEDAETGNTNEGTSILTGIDFGNQ